MLFISQRLFHTKGNPKGDYSLAHLYNDDGSFRSFNLEDTYNEKKIAGSTRFPAGIYPLKLRKEDSPLTKKHREDYAKHPDAVWFKDPKNKNWYHIEITGIENYNFCYFHSGIDDSHTLGCNLPCYGFDLSKQDNPGSRSLAATDKFYSIVYPLLMAGEEVLLDVRDEIKPWPN